MVFRVAVLVRGDMAADKPEFTVDNPGVGLFDGDGPVAEAFYLGTLKGNAALDFLKDLEAAGGPSIAADNVIGRCFPGHNFIVRRQLANLPEKRSFDLQAGSILQGGTFTATRRLEIGYNGVGMARGMVRETAVTPSREYERQLVGRAQADDRLASRELVELHKDRLFSFIWRMVRNHHDAEEICQEAFLKAFASLGTFSSEYRFSTWLFTIGYRVCLNHLRRKRALTGELDFTALPHDGDSALPGSIESEEAGRLKELVWSAVDRLSAPQRATLVLFYRHELSCHEMAQVLELPVATVKSHLHRARNRLRELLESVTEHELQEFRNRAGAAG